jgi:hypothetical protein
MMELSGFLTSFHNHKYYWADVATKLSIQWLYIMIDFIFIAYYY